MQLPVWPPQWAMTGEGAGEVGVLMKVKIRKDNLLEYISEGLERGFPAHLPTRGSVFGVQVSLWICLALMMRPG